MVKDVKPIPRWVVVVAVNATACRGVDHGRAQVVKSKACRDSAACLACLVVSRKVRGNGDRNHHEPDKPRQKQLLVRRRAQRVDSVGHENVKEPYASFKCGVHLVKRLVLHKEAYELGGHLWYCLVLWYFLVLWYCLVLREGRDSWLLLCEESKCR